MSKPRVFMVRETRDNWTDALRFGDVVAIFRGGDDKPPRLFTPEYTAEALRRLDLHGYDPENDYFMVTGDLASVTMIAAAIARDSEVPPRALFYDKSVSEYRPLRLGVDSQEPVDS
jgi:hypothetical protein